MSGHCNTADQEGTNNEVRVAVHGVIARSKDNAESSKDVELRLTHEKEMIGFNKI